MKCLCMVALTTVVWLAGCGSELAREDKVGVRKWPPESIIIRPPHDGCSATYVEFVGRDDERVRMLISGPFEINQLRQLRKSGINSGDAADITVSGGWLYIVGKKHSVGTSTVAAAADSSRLIIDARHSDDEAKVIHPDHAEAIARVWYIKAQESDDPKQKGVDLKHFTQGRPGKQDFEIKPFEQAEKDLIAEITEVCNACGFKPTPEGQ